MTKLRLPEAPTIMTDRLILRDHRATDFEASVHMWSDKDVVRYIGGVPSAPTDVWSRLLRYAGMWKLTGFGYWAVEDRHTGQFVGEVGFADFMRDLDLAYQRLPEAGWVISPKWAGRGYATEAMRAVYEWFDAAMPGSNSFCMITPENAGSIKVAERLGYVLDCKTNYKDSPVEIYLRLAPSDPM